MHLGHGEGLMGVLNHAVVITGFVFVMMLLLEYVNVLTRGRFQVKLSGRGWRQYFLAALLGASPGCLGSFAVVSMYSHGIFSLGAVIAAMISTTGDEMFVMLAKFPARTFLISMALIALGMAVGVVTDFIAGKRKVKASCSSGCLEIHESHIECCSMDLIIRQWKKCIPTRGILTVVLLAFIVGVVSNQIELHELWMEITLLVLSVISLFVVATVPDHFLEDHLWRHVAVEHVPRIFAWTLGAMVVLHYAMGHLHMDNLEGGGKWAMLALACVTGLIPQSGPHMVFVMLFADGAIPMGVFVASCIVQEGHGLLPMLAHSRHVFVMIKILKFVLGFLIGGLLII